MTDSEFHLDQIYKRTVHIWKVSLKTLIWKPINIISIWTIYIANVVHQKEAIYELLKESEIFTKFNIYGLYSTPMALYIYIY